MKASIKMFLAIACDNAEDCNKCAEKHKKAPCKIFRQLYQTSLKEFINTNEYKNFKEKLGTQNGES